MEIHDPKHLNQYAHIMDGKVVNVSLWDGISPYQPVEELVKIPEGVVAGIGWDYVDGQFADNRPVEEEINSENQLNIEA